MKALLDAKKRGVDVRVVVDEKGNKGKANLAALNLVVNAGIPTRTISTYAIHHDKYIVSDDKHVQNGSFNYSQAAVPRLHRRTDTRTGIDHSSFLRRP